MSTFFSHNCCSFLLLYTAAHAFCCSMAEERPAHLGSVQANRSRDIHAGYSVHHPTFGPVSNSDPAFSHRQRHLPQVGSESEPSSTHRESVWSWDFAHECATWGCTVFSALNGSRLDVNELQYGNDYSLSQSATSFHPTASRPPRCSTHDAQPTRGNAVSDRQWPGDSNHAPCDVLLCRPTHIGAPANSHRVDATSCSRESTHVLLRYCSRLHSTHTSDAAAEAVSVDK